MTYLATACAAAALFLSASVELAMAQRIVTGGEPGPGQLNGPKDCVRVEVATSNTGKALCPNSKYMLVCGSSSPNADRKRSCLK